MSCEQPPIFLEFFETFKIIILDIGAWEHESVKSTGYVLPQEKKLHTQPLNADMRSDFLTRH